MELARAFVYRAIANLPFVLRTYSSRGKELRERIKTRSFSFETRTRRPPANRMKALILADRVIFALVNRGEIGPWGFRGELGGIYLRERGMRRFIEACGRRSCTKG